MILAVRRVKLLLNRGIKFSYLISAKMKENGFGELLIHRYKNNVISTDTDFVASEVPIAFVFNGISHAVMLATPLNLVDFALGFSFSEGIIEHYSHVYEIEEIAHFELGIEVRITISNASFMRLKERRRSLAGRTGCGLCGIESLSNFEAGLNLAKVVSPADKFFIHQHTLFNAFSQLQQKQSINAMTGSMHAASWINSQGELLLLREDVGRHNALDKLIGALLREQSGQFEPNRNGCVIMTSRASYELVQKAARANISLLATISAPTSLAVKLAQQSGLTLIGFVRDASYVAYSHAERVRF